MKEAQDSHNIPYEKVAITVGPDLVEVFEGVFIKLDETVGQITGKHRTYAAKAVEVTNIKTGDIPVVFEDDEGKLSAMRIRVEDGEWAGTSLVGWVNKKGIWDSWQNNQNPDMHAATKLVVRE